MRLAAYLVVAAFLCGGVQAADASLIDGSDPQAVVAIAERFGPARLDRDPDGNPLVIGKLDETVYIVEFFGCTGGVDCHAIRFRASYGQPGLSDQEMGEWNRDERFLKAFLDDAGDPVIHMSVNLTGGVSEAMLNAAFARWTSAAARFEDFIGWQP